jgi:hypothetical protein
MRRSEFPFILSLSKDERNLSNETEIPMCRFAFPFILSLSKDAPEGHGNPL